MLVNAMQLRDRDACYMAAVRGRRNFTLTLRASIVLIEGEGAISEHQDNLCHDTDIYRKFY